MPESRGLRIGPKLWLPLDLVVEATAVVGKRGRGKTFTAKRIVEEALRARVTVAIIDPTDVWWGLRSGADGSDKGGLDVVVFGGKHGDLPLHPGTGKMLARLTLDGSSVVLCTKGLVKAERRRIVGEFLTELYDRADGTPILVVVDEADEYAPQGAQSYGNRRDDPLMLSLGAVEDIVRRGRAGGLGSLLITQRVAVLSKNVLEQSDTLIALGVTGKNDIDAVAGWISKHAPDVETGRQITTSLPSLPRGTAWVWSPEYDVLARVEVLPISTFDSSRSPKVGEVVVAPKARKAIDLDALGVEMAEFAEQVKADDPTELKRRIATLERQLAAAPLTAVEPQRVEVPVLTDADRATFDRASASAEGMIVGFEQAQATIADYGRAVVAAVHEISERLGRVAPRPSPQPAVTVAATPPRRVKATGTQPAPARPATTPDRTSSTSAGSNGHVDLSDTETLLLGTLVQRHPVPMTLRELAVRSRRSHTSSTTKTAVSRLRALGLAVGSSGHLTATDAGVHAAGGADPMPTGPELWTWWKERLTNAEYDLLVAVADSGGGTDQEVTEHAGYSVTSSTPKTALSRLRSLGLVQKRNGINVICEELTRG